MIAKNMRELEQMLAAELEIAMQATSKGVLKDMQSETAGYYDGSTPKVYERTYALKDTPRTSPVNRNGNKVAFDAYLDDKHNYTTGKRPPMSDVLNLANNNITNSSVGYLRSTIGNHNFWERALVKMKKTLDTTIGQAF